MNYKDFINKIEYLHEKGQLWNALTSGVSHANTHIGQNIKDELTAIMFKDKEAHSSFKNTSNAEKAVYDLIMYKNNARNLHDFLECADVGNTYKITFRNGGMGGTGIVQNYDGNLEARYSRDIRAVFYKSADSKDTLGLNLDTCFPLLTSERSGKLEKNLAPSLENSRLLSGMCPEEQTYWWSAANSAINLSLEYDDGVFTAEGIETVPYMENGRNQIKDVTLTMTLSNDDCLINTDDGRQYVLLDENDFDKFSEDFPERAPEFITSFDFHERTYAVWDKGDDAR